MLPPDQRLFEEDLLSAEFRSGEIAGKWGLLGSDAIPAGLVWPRVVLWIAAASRQNTADRYFVCLDFAGYRAVPPTGTFWDPTTKAMLAFPGRPKGKPNSRFAKVFRTDWNNGTAFYHPYDRVAAQSHRDQWQREQPHLVWTINHTIVDYLEEIHSLFNSGDYLGI